MIEADEKTAGGAPAPRMDVRRNTMNGLKRRLESILEIAAHIVSLAIVWQIPAQSVVLAAEPAGFAIGRASSPQQARVNEFIQTTGQLASFDEAVKALDAEESDAISMILSMASSTSAELAPELSFSTVLADRRVSRIFGFLSDMPEKDARKACLKMYREKLEGLTTEWLRFSKFYKESQLQIVSPNLHRRHHSLAAAVFLAASFCDPSDAVGLCDEWDETIRSVMKKAEFDSEDYQRKTGVPVMDLFPEQLFTLNIYALILDRNGGGRIQDAPVPKEVHIPKTTYRCLMSWDSRHTPLPTENKAQALLAGADVLMVTPYFHGWEFLHGVEARSKSIAAAKQAVEELRARRTD
jgi:hypothetical protein